MKAGLALPHRRNSFVKEEGAACSLMSPLVRLLEGNPTPSGQLGAIPAPEHYRSVIANGIGLP